MNDEKPSNKSNFDAAQRVRAQDALNTAAASLEDQAFDAVVLMATYRNSDGNTVSVTANRGNWYAVHGLMYNMLDIRRGEAFAEGEQRFEKDNEP